MDTKIGNQSIAVIGLGYVGLPLAVELGSHFDTIGFDVNLDRVRELREGVDNTGEVSGDEIAAARQLRFTTDAADLAESNFIIVTVPTPIDRYKKPDLGPLLAATRTVASQLKRNDIVVYESTVYPGATEEDCVPLLESGSGLVLNHDFFVGYSPERINPGDRKHRLPDITKVVSASTPEALEVVDHVYSQIIRAGTHRAPSIQVAEAAKVIENTQRDLNIALVNELAMIFNRLGINTSDVLAAARTKWNFLDFRPGLVGGHCIGVDPYYLTQRAEAAGYHPQVILAGRRINDNMGKFAVGEVIKMMVRKKISPAESRVLVLGLAFKENCPDIRNSRVPDIVNELLEYGASVDVHDPCVDPLSARRAYGIELIQNLVENQYDAIILAVAHEEFLELGVLSIRKFAKANAVIYDIKRAFDSSEVDGGF